MHGVKRISAAFFRLDSHFHRKLPFSCLLMALLLLGGMLGTPRQAPAAGFALYQQGTGAMAQGMAFVAEANDASAIFYNPAGINQLKGPQVYAATFGYYRDQEYHGPNGEFSQINHRFKPTGAAYFTYPFYQDRVVGGIGFFVPFGLITPWPAGWTGRYLTTLTDLKTYNLNPVLSVKLRHNWSVALGMNFFWADADIRKNIPLKVFGLPDAETILKGDGGGLGVNVGTLFEPIRGVKLGLAYRSNVYTVLKGNLDFRHPQGAPTSPPLAPKNIAGTAKLNFPPTITGGISVSRFQPFTFNFDVTWTGWSTYDKLEVRLQQPVIPIRGASSVSSTPKNWKDSWAFRFGGNYQYNENIKFRAGYTFDMSPVPDSTFEPQLPDNDRHVFAVGGDWKFWKGFTLGLAYSYILVLDRTKNNNIGVNLPLGAVPPLTTAEKFANGRYSADTHSVGVSLKYDF